MLGEVNQELLNKLGPQKSGLLSQYTCPGWLEPKTSPPDDFTKRVGLCIQRELNPDLGFSLEAFRPFRLKQYPSLQLVFKASLPLNFTTKGWLFKTKTYDINQVLKQPNRNHFTYPANKSIQLNQLEIDQPQSGLIDHYYLYNNNAYLRPFNLDIRSIRAIYDYSRMSVAIDLGMTADIVRHRISQVETEPINIRAEIKEESTRHRERIKHYKSRLAKAENEETGLQLEAYQKSLASLAERPDPFSVYS